MKCVVCGSTTDLHLDKGRLYCSVHSWSDTYEAQQVKKTKNQRKGQEAGRGKVYRIRSR